MIIHAAGVLQKKKTMKFFHDSRIMENGKMELWKMEIQR